MSVFQDKILHNVIEASGGGFPPLRSQFVNEFGLLVGFNMIAGFESARGSIDSNSF